MTALTPEGKVKEEVKKIFKRHGVWYFMPVSGGYGRHGISDFIACVAGWFVAVECKATDGMSPTPLQQICMDEISVSGGITFLATPSTLQKLEAIVIQLKINAG